MEGLSSSSSCFICGKSLLDKSAGSRRGRKKKSSVDFKGLVTRVCELLSVPTTSEVTLEDWHNFNDHEQQSICCRKCFELLLNIKKTYEIILKAQQELQNYLALVQSLIVKSESENLQSSLWRRNCFELRKAVLQKVGETRSEVTNLDELIRSIKDEKEHDNARQLLNECDNFNWNGDDQEVAESEEEPVEVFSILKISNQKDINNCESVTTPGSHHGNIVTEGIPNIPNTDLSKCSSSRKRKSKRRKFVVICEEDDEELKKTGKSNLDCRSSKSVKKSLRNSVEASASVGEDNYDHGNDDPELVEDSNSMEASQGESTEDDEGQQYKKALSYSEMDVERRRLAWLKIRGLTRTGKQKCVGRGIRGLYYPFVVVEEDLYLYRRGIYVRKTLTHLHCLFHKCGFKTKWDYYESFQAMRKHIEEIHRSKKYILQMSPYTCPLCNILFPNHDKFWKHSKSVHGEKFGTNARAICESCMMTSQIAYMKVHQYSHKNEEEKAAARAANLVPKRCLRVKESDILERKYVCDFENCRMSFKNPGNLKRHKNTHIPKELRTDLCLCPECGKQIVTDELARHRQRHHYPDTILRTLLCTICDKRFLPCDRGLFEAHIRRHKGEKPFLCTECGASYVSAGSLRGHITNVHPEKNKKFPCDICGKVYDKSMSWRMHVKRKHPEKYPKQPCRWKSATGFYAKEAVKGEFYGPIQQFPCTECDVICKYKFTLRKHMINKHGIGSRRKKPGRPLFQSELLPTENEVQEYHYDYDYK